MILLFLRRYHQVITNSKKISLTRPAFQQYYKYQGRIFVCNSLRSVEAMNFLTVRVGAALLFTPSGYFFHCCHTYVVRAPKARERDLKKTTLSIIFDGPCGFYFYQTRPPPSQGKKTYVKNFLCQYYYLRPTFYDV